MWILHVGPLRWNGPLSPSVVWRSELGARPKREGGLLAATRRVQFQLALTLCGATVESALGAARESLGAGGVELSGLALSAARLAGVDASFGPDGSVQYGELRFEGTLADEPPFPFSFSGPAATFHGAMREASRAIGGLPFLADGIRETPAYWVFPTQEIGCLGAIFDRKEGRAVPMGSAFPIELWVWGYERGLLKWDASEGAVVVTAIRDRERASAPLRELCRRARSAERTDLPFVAFRGPTWMAIPPLHAAGDSVEWHVERATTPTA